MNRESIEFFAAEYPQWWHANPVLQDFPDGWTVILAEFFHALDWLNSTVSQQRVWVSVHFEKIGAWSMDGSYHAKF